MPIFVCELFAELGLDHHIPIDLEEQVEAARRYDVSEGAEVGEFSNLHNVTMIF